MRCKTIFTTILFSFLLLSGNVLFAQIAEGKFADRLEAARKLYNCGAYYAAEQAFNDLSSELGDVYTLNKSEIQSYKVLCAIALDRGNVLGLAKVFEDNYPNAPEIPTVRFTLATHFFDKGDYRTAYSVFKTIEKSHLYKVQELEYYFKYSYCNMRVGNYKEAAAGFKKIIDSEVSSYTIPSIYHLGYVYYLEQNFKESYPLFEKAAKDSRFKDIASYYAVESKFMLKDHDYVIKHGPGIIDKLENDIQANLARIISESYFAKNVPSLAQQYFDRFTQFNKQLSRKDHYFSGILSYSLKSYISAIASFEHVLGETDSLAQNAYYFTANCYLMTKNKLAALSAFKQAADCDFDKVIKEDAFFNYAKLSFDLNSDISQFAKYQEMYPQSGKDDEINSYMAASFLLGKDYNSAVKALTKIKKLSPESSANLQKAAFFRAIQLIENKGYRAAIPMLQISLDNNRDNEMLAAVAKYWLAECYFRDEQYPQAISVNDELISSGDFRGAKEYPILLYNLAYSYFKNGDFGKAQEWFSNYLNIPLKAKSFEKDARVRLGDSYFMQNDYTNAAAEYETVYTKYYTSDDLYPAYQSAVSYGLLGDDAKKIAILKRVTKENRNAPLYSQSLYELGRTYVQRGDDANASECFYTLLGRNSDSTYFAKSHLELAMISANNSRFDKALEHYKTVIEGYPLSSEAQDALTGMESLCQSVNKPDIFLEYIDHLGLSNIKSADEKELMRFSAAEQLFLSGKYSAAMNALQSFVKTYPRGAKSAQAYFYLAQALKATGRKEAAADAYLQVMRMGEGDFSQSATNQYAQISYELGHYGKAVEAYQTLSNIAKSDEMKIEAYRGRMESYFSDKQYESALKDAMRLINYQGVSPDLLRRARFVMAKSYLVQGDRELAKPLFDALSAVTDDEIGAESAYILILDAYDSGDFLSVENKVYSFSDSGTSQLYWLAKSFIVLGDSFADREEWEQARATFESVQNEYKPQDDDDDIQEQVKMRLNRLQSMGR